MKSFYESVSDRANRLMNIAIELNSCYLTCDQLRILQNDENNLINLSPAFFQTIRRALVYELFIETAKLFDKDDEDESIYRLLIDSENNIDQLKNINKPFESNHFIEFNDKKAKVIKYSGISDMILKNKQKIENSEKVLISINKQRNKIYAHYDKRIIRDRYNFLQEFSVSLLDFKIILLLYSNICNDFMNLFSNKTVYPFIVNSQDLSNIIYYTKIGINNIKSNEKIDQKN
jgi:hypothetical protein